MKISIAKGNSRKENIKKAISLIETEIEKAIKAKNSRVAFVKINAIDSNFPIACTHPAALDAVLSVFSGRFEEIIVADNSFVFSKNKGGPYRKAVKRFPNARLSDLTEFDSCSIRFKKLGAPASSSRLCLLPKSAFTISLALPKTHDTFVYTGCLKNMFGCVTKNRGDLHAIAFHEKLFLKKYVESNPLKWQNLVNVIRKTKPDLCILDAFHAMEGDGPIFGTKARLGIAMCSLDGVALDRLAAKICGLGNVPYLSMLPKGSEPATIIKDGFEDIAEISKKLKPHYKTKYQTITELNSLAVPLDIKYIISLLKRSYRLRDKILEKLMQKMNLK